jgi:two-component system response regulator ResD
MTSEQHRRILIVDDDGEVRRLLVAALRQKSLIIDQAEDGAQALDLLRENDYSVVLLDLLMPGVGGFEVLDVLDGNRAYSPVVLVVTGADRSVVEQLDSRRIHGVIRKPFDPDEIAGIVAACADVRGRSAFETMAIATVMSSVPWIGLLKL